ncbi:MAG: hypothetical protein ACOC90_05445 [Bacteroidota bacterium]
MKAIIDGKRYNTETAEKIVLWSNGLMYSDFGHLEETLYRTKKGNYFLHGGGGPKTKYAVQNGQWTSGSQKIIPLTKDEALEWLENHGFADEIEKLFPENIQDA